MTERCSWCAKLHKPGPEHCLHGVLLVCGGREFNDLHLMLTSLDRVADRMEIECVRHGDARGADTMAEDWANTRYIKVDPMPADWDRYKKAAGAIRNAAMLAKAPKPVACVAFTPGPAGTYDMVAKCVAANVPVWKVGWK